MGLDRIPCLAPIVLEDDREVQVVNILPIDEMQDRYGLDYRHFTRQYLVSTQTH